VRAPGQVAPQREQRQTNGRQDHAEQRLRSGTCLSSSAESTGTITTKAGDKTALDEDVYCRPTV